MPDLCFVPFPEFKRSLALPAAPQARTELFAALCRINALYMITRAGSGHIGSSFSSLDLVAWLFLNELRLSGQPGAQDLYFSSKGHDVPGLYAVLLGLGLLDFDLLHQLRRLHGLPGHPDVHTPHIVTNSGPLGMGVSKAKGLLKAQTLQGQPGRLFVLTGDGELQEGQFWESLPSAANNALDDLTVIVDHNKIQSDTWVARVSDLGDLEAKLRAFGWHVARCDGHDLNALSQALTELRGVAGRPKVLIADTLKGRGVSFMEHIAMQPADRLYRFHSGAPDDETYAQAAGELVQTANRLLQALAAPELALEWLPRPPRATADGKQRLVSAYGQALVDQARRNPRLVALDADLALDCGLLPFEAEFPDRFVECGIAEQDMVSQAGGLALGGLLPVVHSFACFLSTRPNEQIYNNATEQTRVVYVGSLAGLLPSGPGHSHQSVRDIAALSAIPGLTLLEPSCEPEVALALDYCLNQAPGSSYLRLVSIPCAVNFDLPAGYQLVVGRGVTLRQGTDAVIFGYGPVLLPEALRAADRLQAEHAVSVKVVNLPWLNRLDSDWLRAAIAGAGWVFTLDNHYLAGGQGEMIAARLAELRLERPPALRRFGLTDIPACGANDEVLAYHQLDAASLAQAMAQAMQTALA